MRSVCGLSLVLACGLLGCTGSHSTSPSPDAGLADAGPVDAGALDAGPADAGPVDAGPRVPAIHFRVNDQPQHVSHPEADVTESRYGDPVRVVVDGLASQAQVTVEGRTNGMKSSAVFVADAAGVVDLGRDAPQRGTWPGADLDGIFWSMVQDTPPPQRLDLDLQVTVLDGATPLLQATLHRRYINEGLVVEQVAQGTRRGVFARPAGDGPFPAVLVFGGSEGGTGTGVYGAEYLASLGYAALGVGYFGATGLPATLENVPLEILQDDLQFLAGHDHVDGRRLGVMGGSRGGELALLLGAHFAVVHAVVAEVPSGLVWGSTESFTKGAWTLDGGALPWVPYSGAQGVVTTDADGGTHYNGRGVYLADIAAASPAALDAATTRVEDTDGGVLLFGGADDQLWPSCTLAQVAFDRLTASHHTDNGLDQLLCLPGTGHLIGQPGWSTIGAGEDQYLASENLFLVVGGAPEATAHAQRTTDTAIRGFLEQALAP